ncbi:MAG: DUF6054 family protein [Filifactor alocis]|nr:DUF6054 family protein [Filifactor alocis]
MAKYERCFQGRIEDVLSFCEKIVMEESMTSSFEGGSDFEFGDTRVAVRVYERYSGIGGNRVSLNLTVVANEQRICVSAITSGGSQAMFWKINTWGEEAFLETLSQALDDFVEKNSGNIG